MRATMKVPTRLPEENGEKTLSGLAGWRVFSNVLKMTESQALLTEYFENGSEQAFRELVERYIDLVFAAAVRLVDGDTHLAEDVIQTVFADLACMRGRISADAMLGGWLHRHTCFVAANTIRARRRRENRERQAVEMNAIENESPSQRREAAPFLDEAIDQLEADDRTAIVLRFFEQRDFRSVGVALGSSEEAARKRVDRALDKLQQMLKRQGITVSAGALAVVLAGEAATAAPAGLAAVISGTALAGGAKGGAILFKIMTLTKLKVAAAAVMAGMAAAIVVQSQSNAKLLRENQALREQLAPMERLRADNERLAKSPKVATSTPVDQKSLDELLRLRGEVTRLKRQLADAGKVDEQDKRLLAALKEKTAVQPEDAAREMAVSKMGYDRKWLLASILFAQEYPEKYPTNLEQLAPYLKDPNAANTNNDTNHSPADVEIVYLGPLSTITNPANTILIRGTQPWQTADGNWVNDYGFADGHSEIHSTPDGNFQPWEKQHIQVPPGAQ